MTALAVERTRKDASSRSNMRYSVKNEPGNALSDDKEARNGGYDPNERAIETIVYDFPDGFDSRPERPSKPVD